MDTAHDNTERLNPSRTATQYPKPPWRRIDGLFALQTYWPRVIGLPRSM
jgi:hypothetical protein